MNKKGFTLVELMLVIVIIGIISVITIPNIMEALDDSRTEGGSTMEKTLKKDLELYNTDNEEDMWDDSKSYECQTISFAELKESNPDINLGECLFNNQEGYLTIVKVKSGGTDASGEATCGVDDEDDEESALPKMKYEYYVGITCGKDLKAIASDEDLNEAISIDDKPYIVSGKGNSSGKKGNVYFTSKGYKCKEAGEEGSDLTLHVGNNSSAVFSMDDCQNGEENRCRDNGKTYVFPGSALSVGRSYPDPFPSIDLDNNMEFMGWYTEQNGRGQKVNPKSACYNETITHLWGYWENHTAPDVETEIDPEKPDKVVLQCEEEGNVLRSYYVGKTDPYSLDDSDWTGFNNAQSENNVTISINQTGTYYFACKDKDGNIGTLRNPDTNDPTTITFYEVELKMINGRFRNYTGRFVNELKVFASNTVGLKLPRPEPTTGYATIGAWYKDNTYTTIAADYDNTFLPSSNITLYSKADVKKYSVTLQVINGSGGTTQQVEHGHGVVFDNIRPDENFTSPTYECDEGVNATFSGNRLTISNVNKDIQCKVSYHDDVKPNSVTFTSTNNLADHQSAELTCSDNTRIISYYFGSTAPNQSSSYTAVNPIKTLELHNQAIEGPGTYYFACKDTDGNVSDVASRTFYETSLSMEHGTVSHEIVLTMQGNSFTLPTPTASTGYTVMGKWFANEELQGEGLDYNSEYTPSQTDVLYSDSTINTSTLKINPNGGKVVVRDDAGVEDEITDVQTYTQDYNSILAYQKPTKGNDVDTSEHYTISYDSDGGNAVNSQTSIITKTTVYTFTNFTKSNPFYGVLSSTTGAGTYKYPPEKDVTSMITANFSHVVNTSVAHVHLASAPSKEGHTFKGWKSSVNGQVYNAGSDYEPSQDVTMTAQWEINKYNVSITVNNGVVADDEESSKVVVFNQDVTFSVVPSLTDAPGSVSCTNGQSATIENDIVTVSHVKNNTVCTVTYKTEMTVLFNDGTLIINELPNHREANITRHGSVVKEYEPMSASNIYYFSGEDDNHLELWHEERASITRVEIGHTIKPVITKMWFYDLFNLESGDFTNLDMSEVTDMYSMFEGTGSTVSSYVLTGLSGWNVGNVTNMANLFHAAGSSAATWSLGDLSNWNTSEVTSMGNMFNAAGINATSFNVGDLSNWKTGNVQSMASMFQASGVNSASWSVGDLSEWNVKNVTEMASMFSQAGSSTTTTWDIGDLSEWDVSNVGTMSSMFNEAGKEAAVWHIGDLSSWDTRHVTHALMMFQNAGASATVWDIGDLSGWDVSHVEQAISMFSGAGASANQFILNVSGWDFASYGDIGFGQFFTNAGKSASKFEIDVTNWKNIKGGLISMFEGAGANATDWKIKGLSTWNVSQATNTEKLFSGAGTNATTWDVGDLSSWNLTNATSVSEMFKGISSVGTFNNIGTLKIYATKMDSMFNGSPKAKATLQLYNNPTSYSNAFESAATDSNALITVDYKSSVTNIDNIIATKSYNSNVVKGSII